MTDQGDGASDQPAFDAKGEPCQRWEGVLSAAQVQDFKRTGRPLAFCPVQIGWVAMAEQVERPSPRPEDPSAPLSWTVARPLGAFTVRPWSEADAPAYRVLLDDSELWRFMPEAWPGGIDEDMARDLIAISNAAAHHEVWAVLHEDAPFGQVRFAFAENGQNRAEAEVSYWFGRAYWGRGFGRRVVRKMTAQAFRDHPGLRRVIAHVHPDNHGSAKVLIAAGYTACGHRPDGWRIFEIMP